MAVVWKMSHRVAERAYYLQQALDNYEIDVNTFREELAKLPGYPLSRLLQSGDDLILDVHYTPTSSARIKRVSLPN